MPTDIIELRDFYQSPLGRMARRVLRARMTEMWPNMQGEKVLVLGYGVPLLRALSQQASSLYAFMPAAQGVSFWPREGPNIATLVDSAHLPLAHGSIDRVIVLHVIETLAEPAVLLSEIWRVLKGGGRLLTIVPNRRGLWAHSDRTPFGHGQPYSPSQIRGLLHNHGFLIERMRHSLYALPNATRFGLSLADKIEKYGVRLFPGFGGVLLVEAGKQLYAPQPVQAIRRHRLVLPLAMPTPAGLPT
jgi:SAM-dependent methyltransferase